MTQAQSSRRQVAFIVESAFGTTPSTPQTQLLEFVDFDGEMKADRLKSKSQNSNRQTNYARRGNTSTEGMLKVEAVHGNFDWLLEAILQGTWTSDVLKVGSTQRSFAVEEGFLDLAQYRVFNGVVFDSLSMEVTPDDYVQIDTKWIGASVTAFSGTSIDSTPTAVAAKQRFYHEGGTFSEGGSSVGYITSIKLDVSNSVSGNKALGTAGFRGITSGRFDLKGSLSATFENVTLYNKFKNNTDSVLEWMVASTDGSHTIRIPKLNYTEGKINAPADGVCTVELSFDGSFDATDATTIMITRA